MRTQATGAMEVDAEAEAGAVVVEGGAVDTAGSARSKTPTATATAGSAL